MSAPILASTAPARCAEAGPLPIRRQGRTRDVLLFGVRGWDGVQLAMGMDDLSFPRRGARLSVSPARFSRPSRPIPQRRDKLNAGARRAFRSQAHRAQGRYSCLSGWARSATARLPESIRTPGMRYRDGGAVLGTFPAMLATVTDATGRAVSIHRTHWDCQKAPVAARRS